MSANLSVRYGIFEFCLFSFHYNDTALLKGLSFDNHELLNHTLFLPCQQVDSCRGMACIRLKLLEDWVGSYCKDSLTLLSVQTYEKDGQSS